ncbi:hypothetical protein QAD02_019232 [Eretmocerus hayati]|uniref:Uncharacterized protein n=1 Tax=Eretmocerus hayati TaxID=131215 RepID=A0ACC2PIL3_9HYME|nr:hypothetical protein QAD02_019232 [Eretmocerus hayati]
MSEKESCKENPQQVEVESLTKIESECEENAKLCLTTVNDHLCSVTEKVDTFVVESKDFLQNSVGEIKENIDVNVEDIAHLSTSLENQKLESYNGSTMEIDHSDDLNNHCTDGVSVSEQDNNEEEKEQDSELVTESENSTKDTEPVKLIYKWNLTKLISCADQEFKPTDKCENFTKGCFWSPDGTRILVPAEDFKLRLFELPHELYSGKLPPDYYLPTFESSLQIKEGGTVYDTCWYPYMNAWDPSTCCFLSTSQGSPVHLWDASTGELRATYRAYNLVDEVEAAISVQFTDYGSQIWSGFKNALRTFDTHYPGRQTNTIFLKKDFPNVTGMVSCIRENPAMTGLIAFGTYSKCIGLYKDGPLCTFMTGSGVTQIEFSPCGTRLYSSVRKGGELLCWDLRNPGSILYSLQNRQSDTNQRIYFDLLYNGQEIVSGGTDGSVQVWQIPDHIEVDEDLYPKYKIQISKDCVNGVSLHKNLPILAVCTGRRICDEENCKNRENSLRFYWMYDYY